MPGTAQDALLAAATAVLLASFYTPAAYAARHGIKGEPSIPAHVVSSLSAADWQAWLTHFGHDTYQYPAWVTAQIHECKCEPIEGGHRHECKALDKACVAISQPCSHVSKNQE